MPGGLNQLAATGTAQDKYFTVSPEITFFKSVFKRHTRFAIETIEKDFNKTTIHETNKTEIRVKIERNGDLLKSLNLVFELPAIYSGQIGSAASDPKLFFKWIKNIGFYIIEKAELVTGKTVLQTLSGEWLDVYKELYLSDEEKDSVNNMIGNTVDMHSPELSKGNKIQASISAAGGFSAYNAQNIRYPHSKTLTGSLSLINLSSETVINSSSVGSINNTSPNSTIPTINGKTIRVPLFFWFSKAASLAYPLISAQKEELELKITLRSLNDLYTVSDISNNGAGSATQTFRIKNPNDASNFPYANIGYFLEDTTNSKQLQNNTLNINTKVAATYIFLDNEERRDFAEKGEHMYIIESYKPDIINNFSDHRNFKDSNTIVVNSSQPIKDIIIIPQRTDAPNVNEWGNFTNWIQQDVRPTSFQSLQSTEFNTPYYDTIAKKYPFPSRQYSSSFIRREYLGKDLIKNIEILVGKGSNNRLFKKQDSVYFQNQQVLEYFKTSSKDGIYVYTFSLNPTNPIQPSGYLNISDNDLSLKFTFPSLPVSTSYSSGDEVNNVSDYGIRLNVYLVQYRLLKITGGEVGIMFSD